MNRYIKDRCVRRYPQNESEGPNRKKNPSFIYYRVVSPSLHRMYYSEPSPCESNRIIKEITLFTQERQFSLTKFSSPPSSVNNCTRLQ